jgi:hypothetical protein
LNRMEMVTSLRRRTLVKVTNSWLLNHGWVK